MSDYEYEFHPPAQPGNKFKLILTRKHDVPLTRPLRVCIICEKERQSSAFTPMADGGSPICDTCKRPHSVRGLPWSVDVRWSDRVAYEDAAHIVKMIERECCQ